QRNFSGVIAPVLTPFGEDGAPDPDRFIEHAEWLLEDGCTALAPFGTTSEANSLGLDERMELLEELVDSGIDPAKLMPGTGSCSVTDATILTQHAVDLGCGGVLMLPPFYYKNPSEEGLFRFFAEVIDDVGDDRLRVYLYHIPPVAQVGFSLSLIDRLRKEFPGIVVGLKDSSGDWSNMKAILDAFPDFELFPGSELFLLEGLRNGAAGVISATANVSARAMRRLYDDWRGPNAEALQEEISALRRTIQSFPVIPTLKALIAHYRNDRGWAEVRPPFTPLPPAEAERAIKLLADQHNFRLEFAEAA
ncbi:MAG TPA: dihydrodipicolinate synthase family protein, partial [Hyphomicrobiaceae bacterium]|nr:dihydrodipicolinate synthase family protein [Hyphomicrobiaceae bacterium]